MQQLSADSKSNCCCATKMAAALCTPAADNNSSFSGSIWRHDLAHFGPASATPPQCYVVHLTAVDKNSPPSTNGLAPLAIGFAVFLASWLPGARCMVSTAALAFWCSVACSP